MADYYTQLSMAIGNEWPARAKVDCAQLIGAISTCEIADAPGWYQAAFPEIGEGAEFEEFIFNELCGPAGVNAEIEGETLYLYSDVSANVEALAHVIFMVEQHYVLDGIVAIEYAGTCSKPRTDAFGGGVIEVSKDGGIRSWHTSMGIPPTSSAT
jgi:hypothetical protein